MPSWGISFPSQEVIKLHLDTTGQGCLSVCSGEKAKDPGAAGPASASRLPLHLLLRPAAQNKPGTERGS